MTAIINRLKDSIQPGTQREQTLEARMYKLSIERQAPVQSATRLFG